MKIVQIHPGCGIPVPPPDWGAIEKIVWEFHCNFEKLGYESHIKFVNEVHFGQYDIVLVHVANLALDLAERGIPYIYQLHDHHVVHHGKESSTYRQNLEAIKKSTLTLVPARFLVNYFDEPNVQYFSHGVNIDQFYPIYKTKPQEPKLLMIAANGLGGDPGFDRKGFTYGVALAAKRNLPITIAGPSFNKTFFNHHLWMFTYPKLNLVFDTPNSKLLELYHSHDIFIHPTMLEAGHPNLTMVEASAAGLPLIANWEHETLFHGAWRSSRNVFEMERGLDDILENWDFYRQRAINTGKELSWENRTKELLNIFKQVL